MILKTRKSAGSVGTQTEILRSGLEKTLLPVAERMTVLEFMTAYKTVAQTPQRFFIDDNLSCIIVVSQLLGNETIAADNTSDSI